MKIPRIVLGSALSAAITLSMVALATPAAHAAAITVPNFSFENPDTAEGTNQGAFAGWTGGNDGLFDPSASQITGAGGDNVQGSGMDGGQAVFVFASGSTNPGFITSDAALTQISLGTVYTLTVGVARELGSAGTRPNFTPTLELLANGTVFATRTLSISDLPTAGTFVDFVLTSDVTTTNALVGQNLTIRLSQPGADNFPAPDFDNVRLDGTAAVPEPTSAVMLLGGLGLFGLFQRRRLVA